MEPIPVMDFVLRCRFIVVFRFTVLLCIGIPLPISAAAADVESAPPMSLAELRKIGSANEWATVSFRLHGVVHACSSRLGLLVLEDESSTDLLELPLVSPDIRPGVEVVIEGIRCQVSRGPHALRLGTAPLVELEGTHALRTASGSLFLQKGLHPFRVEWFNGGAGATLQLEYEREGLPRQKVPKLSYWHREGGKGEIQPGLAYAAYEVDGMLILPDFTQLKPTASGVVPDLDVGIRSRPEMAAVVFNGLLKVPSPGQYRFHLASDDGGRLHVTDTAVSCEIVRSDGSQNVPDPVKNVADVATVDGWTVFEGVVGFASKSLGQLELEVTGDSKTFHVTVLDGTGLEAADLQQRRVRIEGLRKNSGMLVMDKQQLRILSDGRDKEKILSQVVEIRQLQRDEADKPYRVEIQGVVTMVTPSSMVLQDGTGGVFVHHRTSHPGNPPHPMELWKIEGRTGAGDFAPVIYSEQAMCVGSAPLPMAVQPTQQQLASGSLDAEMVEIEGVVTEVTQSKIKLLTRGGKSTITHNWLYPLPTASMSPSQLKSLVGSVVRLRGVYRAIWDEATGSVQSSACMLGNASLSVNEPAAGAPFSEPLTRASDLLLFTSHPTALRRVRIKGQILHEKSPELYLFDGTSGFRGIAAEKQDLLAGDEVEVSGFPELGGPSPVLLDARVRKMGQFPLPVPTKVPYWDLPNTRYDSTMVEVVGTLLSNTVRLYERSLEMRAGSNRFVAIIPSDVPMPKGVERDSILRLTGVYINSTTDEASSGSDPFEMRLAGAESIVVVKRGLWWSTRHTIMVISILSLALIMAASWVTLLRRTVARRTNELAAQIEERELIERHRAMEKERSRMAKNLHDELGSGITVAGLLGSLMKNPEVTEEQKEGYLDQLNELCCTLVTGLDEIVWAVNPRYDSVADLAGYFSLYAERFLKLAGLECRLTIDEAITKDPLDSRSRHEIFLAFKEALNNIVKHSGASLVHLTIEVGAGNLRILLADDGTGFDPSQGLPGSDGLMNMRERIESLGGTCTIDSQLRKGTTVRFEISLKQP